MARRPVRHDRVAAAAGTGAAGACYSALWGSITGIWPGRTSRLGSSPSDHSGCLPARALSAPPPGRAKVGSRQPPMSTASRSSADSPTSTTSPPDCPQVTTRIVFPSPTRRQNCPAGLLESDSLQWLNLDHLDAGVRSRRPGGSDDGRSTGGLQVARSLRSGVKCLRECKRIFNTHYGTLRARRRWLQQPRSLTQVVVHHAAIAFSSRPAARWTGTCGA